MHPRNTIQPAVSATRAVAVLALLGGLAGIVGCSAARGARASTLEGGAPASGSTSSSATQAPRTRAERTGYRETSTYTDVVAFLDSLQKLKAPIEVGSIGKTTEGRDIPMVILSRPLVRTPEEARTLGRPIVYVQGNIHAGEVEGKEALQALIRDLALDPTKNVLDSIVLVAVPIYNADGNERFAPQEKNRGAQNGPEMVGQRPNAQGLDLNRDYVKAEAPETRASLEQLTRWAPQVFVDLHTTDGSYHGYALTYSPSLNPAAMFGGVYARDSMLPELRRRMRARHGLEVFDYGNFVSNDSAEKGWFTYEAFPRYGTNYVGLRGRISILSEAYSHDPFERRVASTDAFVREILSLTAERAAAIRALSRRADSSVVAWARDPARSPPIPLRSEQTRTPYVGDVIAENLVRTGDTLRTEPGVPRGVRRAGTTRTVRMPVIDRFAPTLSRTLPLAYIIPAADTQAVRLLRAHGVAVERTTGDSFAAVQTFTIDSVQRSARAFQGHSEVRLTGHWRALRRPIAAGSYYVSAAQPLGIVAYYLLEPESDDGLTTWNVFDREIAPGGDFPVLRVTEPITAPRQRVTP